MTKGSHTSMFHLTKPAYPAYKERDVGLRGRRAIEGGCLGEIGSRWDSHLVECGLKRSQVKPNSTTRGYFTHKFASDYERKGALSHRASTNLDDERRYSRTTRAEFGGE